MRKALSCAALETRLFLRSGRIVPPLIALLAYLAVFYAVLPVDIPSSIALSGAATFALAAWLSLSHGWSEDATLARILSVKAGPLRYALAQSLLTGLFCVVLSLLPAAWPFLFSTFRQGFFTRLPGLADVRDALLTHAAASLAGGQFAFLFYPRLMRDRKLAWTLCLLALLLGLTGGIAGLPLPARLALPPLYDALLRAGAGDAFPAGYVPLMTGWYCAYAAACAAARTALLLRRDAL